jgi:hypothetical protein
MERFDKARQIAGVPFHINSGYRCEKHNKEVGGKKFSSHLRGKAGDIACYSSWQRFFMVDALIKAGFTRIGLGKNFIHADDDEAKEPRVIWLY